MITQILNLLIIDDNMPKEKGYDQINNIFPNQFQIDLCRTFNRKDSAEGIELIRRKKYDLILLDYSLNEGGSRSRYS